MARLQRHTVPLVQPQLLEGRDPVALVEAVKRLLGADHRQYRLVQPDALLQQLQRPGPGPAGPKATRETRRLDRPAASRSSTACLNRATRVSARAGGRGRG